MKIAYFILDKKLAKFDLPIDCKTDYFVFDKNSLVESSLDYINLNDFKNTYILVDHLMIPLDLNLQTTEQKYEYDLNKDLINSLFKKLGIDNSINLEKSEISFLRSNDKNIFISTDSVQKITYNKKNKNIEISYKDSLNNNCLNIYDYLFVENNYLLKDLLSHNILTNINLEIVQSANEVVGYEFDYKLNSSEFDSIANKNIIYIIDKNIQSDEFNFIYMQFNKHKLTIWISIGSILLNKNLEKEQIIKSLVDKIKNKFWFINLSEKYKTKRSSIGNAYTTKIKNRILYTPNFSFTSKKHMKSYFYEIKEFKQ